MLIAMFKATSGEQNTMIPLVLVRREVYLKIQ